MKSVMKPTVGKPRNGDQRLAGRLRRSIRGTTLATIAGILVTGCSLDKILKNEDIPPNLTDPAITKTPAGAIAAYYGTLAQFRGVFGSGSSEPTNGSGSESTFPAIAGVLSDELQRPINSLLDKRDLPEGEFQVHVDGAYRRLQRVRGQASQAIGLLTRYAPDSLALIGHLFALQGYAEVFLADLFCSGIPLSTLDFDGDYTYRPGSSTQQVYEHARALFDTAIVLSTDSTRFVELARLGRARALLSLGDFAQAAAASSQVPDGYRYTVAFTAATGANAINFFGTLGQWPFTVSDGEGINGLDYRSSGDPRTEVTEQGTEPNTGLTIYHPNKYATDGSSPIVLGDWIEARLVESEAALSAGNATWLVMLNTLRTNGTFTTQPNATDPTKADTLWNAGSGGVARLAPLSDPGTLASRVDLVFRERAFWLFLTGHRQGDMRRLIRQYGRDPQSVYPTGSYSGTIGGEYGSAVNAPIPITEHLYNPQFTGCISRGA